MYSYGTTLSIWLGVFLPCAAIIGMGGLMNIENDGTPVSAAFVFCAGTWVVGLLIGLIGGIYFLAPWWMLTQLATARNVDAAALDVISNRTQPTSGIYHFQPTAFVNQDRYGYILGRRVIERQRQACLLLHGADRFVVDAGARRVLGD